MTTLTDGTVITEELFDRIMVRSLAIMKEAAPNPSTRHKPGGSTGNLALNAVRVRNVDRENMRFEIYVNVDMAPYMSYVTSKTHWADGRPYEYHEWFDKAVEEVVHYIATLLGGKVIKS